MRKYCIAGILLGVIALIALIYRKSRECNLIPVYGNMPESNCPDPAGGLSYYSPKSLL